MKKYWFEVTLANGEKVTGINMSASSELEAERKAQERARWHYPSVSVQSVTVGEM